MSTENTNEIHIDVSKIPKRVQENLAAATLDLINGILAREGGRELLEQKEVELGLVKKPCGQNPYKPN